MIAIVMAAFPGRRKDRLSAEEMGRYIVSCRMHVYTAFSTDRDAQQFTNMQMIKIKRISL